MAGGTWNANVLFRTVSCFVSLPFARFPFVSCLTLRSFCFVLFRFGFGSCRLVPFRVGSFFMFVFLLFCDVPFRFILDILMRFVVAVSCRFNAEHRWRGPFLAEMELLKRAVGWFGFDSLVPSDTTVVRQQAPQNLFFFSSSGYHLARHPGADVSSVNYCSEG